MLAPLLWGRSLFRTGESLSGEAGGANALHCLGCFGRAGKWKQNTSARAREHVRFLLSSYIHANKGI